MAQKRSKNQIRRARSKQRKVEPAPETTTPAAETNSGEKPVINSVEKAASETNPVPVAPVAEIAEDELYSQFSDVFQKFSGSITTEEPVKEEKTSEVFFNDDNDSSLDDSSSEDEVLSKRQYRKLHKVPLSALRASVARPQVVEWFDADAPDSYLLVKIKSLPNIIQVPDHWLAKRDYLTSRKGIERLPFQLPKFIRDTGIQEMRTFGDDQTLKQLQRDRVQPKMGRLDIDYQKLFDAFFKNQTKPRIFGYGDVYYEGIEAVDVFSDEVVNVVPGRVSKQLRVALGMTEDESIPPPWISIMREVGKPPAYEEFLVPGLDVDYNNGGYKSLYAEENGEVAVDYWGRPEEGEEEEEEEEEEEDDDEDEDEEEEEEGFDEKQEVGQQEEEEERTTAEPKTSITEFSKVKTTRQKPTKDSGPKTLYTVLETSKSDADNGLLKGEYQYNLSKESQPESKQEKSPEVTSTKKFKF